MQNKTIWLTGSEGRLGSALLELLKDHLDYKVIDTDLDVDVTSADAVDDAVRVYRPNIIINCASLSDADYCETHPLEAYRVNALGARNLAAAARRVDSEIIQFSTDDVFSGEHNRAKTEFDIPTPSTVYGKSKFAGEEFVKVLNPKHLIIRSSWVYGLPGKENHRLCYYDEVLEHGKKGEPFTAPIDVIGSPTSAQELAKFFMAILDESEYGLYHAACKGACTRFGFAKTILELNGFDTRLVRESRKDDAGTLVATQLENLMMEMTGIYEMPAWQDALEEYVKQQGAN